MEQNKDFTKSTRVNVNLKTTEPLDSWGGARLWHEGYILRLDPQTQTVIPFKVFYDPTSGRILTNTLPPEIREEYESSVPEMEPIIGHVPSEEFKWEEDSREVNSEINEANSFLNWEDQALEMNNSKPTQESPSINLNNWGE